MIRYLEWLYVARYKGHEISYQQLVPATIICILLFQGLPAFIALSNSVSTMIAMRMSIRICGGVSSLVFRKAQQLPLCSLDNEEASAVKKWDIRKEAKAKEKRQQESQRSSREKSRDTSGRATPDSKSKSS